MLFATPFVATINDSTKNLDLLNTDDFLSKPGNVIVLRLTESPFLSEEDQARTPAGNATRLTLPLADGGADPTPFQRMRLWAVSDVADFLQRRDLCAAARVLQQNDCNGKDFCSITGKELVDVFRMTPFLAEKVLQARQEYCGQSM